jgi:TAG lipase/lysophosphatidylethanolamine acyltransferase
MIWRWNGRELKRRMHQIDMAVGLPRGLRRFLIDEKVPFKSITMVPEIRVDDFLRLLHNPTKEEIDYWILLGEKSVWPCVAELKVRCDIELALERCERELKGRRHHRSPSALEFEEYGRVGGSSRRRTRVRSDSADTNPI